MQSSQVNLEQQQAIQHNSGHLLILAGPGTGKTSTITRRIAYILQEKLVNPSAVLAVTFTQKAAQEMQSRLQHLLPDSAPLPFVGTFHKIALHLLRLQPSTNTQQSPFTILTSTEKTILFQEISQRFKLTQKTLRKFESWISFCKNQNVSPSNFVIPEVSLQKAFLEVANLYNQRLQALNMYDLDDLLLRACRTLKEDAQFRTSFQKQIEYLFIDEYQDVNEIQYQFIKLLAGSATICAIGDPDQAIYAFRGSNVEHFLRFQNEFSGTKFFALQKNYRSTQNILAVSKKLIQYNQKRLPQDLESTRELGTKIQLFQVEQEWAEAEIVTQEINKLVGGFDMLETDLRSAQVTSEKKYHFGDIAVLYRTHGQARIFEQVFQQKGIPYHCLAATPWYGRQEIQILLAYLQVIINPHNNFYFAEILNIPERGLSKKSEEMIKEFAKVRKISLFEALSTTMHELVLVPFIERESLARLVTSIQELQKLLPTVKVSDLVRVVIETWNLKAFFDDSSAKGAKKLQNIELLVASCYAFDGKSAQEALPELLHYYALLQAGDVFHPDLQAVNMLTLHAAKGLEFPVVFICGLEDGLLPFRKEGEAVNVEEERRLLYVGMTRAKEKLYLLQARNRNGKAVESSPFVNEIENELEIVKIEKKRKKQANDAQISLF